MRINEILLEMASAKLYHYTGIHQALKILQDEEFRLTAAVGNQSERKLNRNRLYFLSTSRNKSNDYVRYASHSAVMFNLNGNWFNRHYKVVPADYWERMWLGSHNGNAADVRTSEQEDRVLSNKPTISFKGQSNKLIDSIHVLVEPDGLLKDDTKTPSFARKVILTAKRLGIPVFFYTERRAFVLQNPSKQQSPKLTQKHKEKRWPTVQQRDKWITPWIELYFKNSVEQLSKRASKLAYDITTSWIVDADHGLENDIHNGKNPNNKSRGEIEKLLDIMKKEGITEPKDYAVAMRKKWRKIKGYDDES